ncbi:DNA cytosine methyltransferase [Hydrogenophaga palleronii]|uniref:DNA cytosine methyltransferase n=1 Tax=Hydrogenophaga palleronii TaxID=65655 RepID=UPI000A0700F9|nr:DNA cytosine methyltransferase [Hydrogenophaga palleronii]
MNRPIGVDLFAGAGGLSLGFEQAGFDVVAAVEIDPIHCAIHERNFPLTKTICASVVNLTGTDLRRLAGLGSTDIDVVFGGAPCQGFSLIGKRALDDERNQLVFHYVRLIRELQPKYFVFENVKGLTLGLHSKFLHELIDALADAGYDVLTPYQVLNASSYGVPQDRKRLFLMGARRGLTLPTYPKPLNQTVTVADAIGDLPDADKFKTLKVSDSVSVKWETLSIYGRRLRDLERDPLDFGYRREFDRDLLSSSLRTEHTQVSKQRFRATLPGETEPISRFRKLPSDGLCNTLRAGTDSARGAFTSPRPIHPTAPRVITVREAARLHSFPDWFRFHSTKWHGFRQIGNSVPPLLGRAVAAEVLKALGLKPSKPQEKLQPGLAELLQFDMGQAARHFEVPRNTIAQRSRAREILTAEETAESQAQHA